MNYEEASSRYVKVRGELEALDREYKEKKAAVKERMVALENWFTAKAQEDGLETVKTPYGTAYWSTHHSATVGSREELFSYCKKHDAWDLIESRASRAAVRSHIETHGEVPPGVNYGTIKVFNFRRNQNRG